MVGKYFLPLLASVLLAMQGLSAAAMPVALPPVVEASAQSEAQASLPLSKPVPQQGAAAMPDCHPVGTSTSDSSAVGAASLPGGVGCDCDCLHAIALPVASLPALRPVLVRFAAVVPSLAGPAVSLSRELRPPIFAQS
jgi:hypothetical protein